MAFFAFGKNACAILAMSIQIQAGNGDVTITNDGATILKQMQVLHPVARMVCVLYAWSVRVLLCLTMLHPWLSWLSCPKPRI